MTGFDHFIPIYLHPKKRHDISEEKYVTPADEECWV